MPTDHSVIQSMPRREFLGWTQPALQVAAHRLEECYRQGNTLDLSDVLVVVPGQRAGRRLQELLAYRAEQTGLLFAPPVTVTEGRLPELLYVAQLPVACNLTQQLTWAQVLSETELATLHQILHHPPAPSETVEWLKYGRMLQQLHTDLAADGLTFAMVSQQSALIAQSQEKNRWNALAAIQERYLQRLQQLSLVDLQMARLTAIRESNLRVNQDIILLGMVDLNQVMRQMLKHVSARVTAYIIAPPTHAEHFDQLGCLIPELWQKTAVPLKNEQLQQVNNPAEQVEAVTTWLAELQGRYCQEEITIGVADESLVSQLRRQLTQYNVRSRWVEGIRLGESAAYRLLQVAIQFASTRSYDHLAELVRHPGLEEWLTRQFPAEDKPPKQPLSLPSQLDCYYNQHFPNRMGPTESVEESSRWPNLVPALAALDQWLAPATTRHPLSEWAGIFRGILGTIYDGRTLDLSQRSEDILHQTLKLMLDACEQLGTIPSALVIHKLTATEAFHIVLAPLADETLPPAVDPGAIEILGWLELPLDDAPALIVTSFNEGFVPQNSGADPFLPDRLRQELGLMHHARRLTRDAYATTVLCYSRPDLRVVFARLDTANNPLQPSRLLFAGDQDTLLQRAVKYFSSECSSVTPHRLLLAPAEGVPAVSHFRRPLPLSTGHRRVRFSVTEFRDYLACPYRYYLHHICRLRTMDDQARELDGGDFGALLHGILGLFGRNPDSPRNSLNEQEIFEYLAKQLDHVASRWDGGHLRRPAIRLQLEQARLRLRAFARVQAAHRDQGWEIVYAENEATDLLAVPFPVDKERVTLVGRIDRIDYHQDTQKLLILDYKTGDRAKHPDQTHQQSGVWTDLQLPLYRHLWRSARLLIPGRLKNPQVELAYWNLPQDEKDSSMVLANWDATMLAEADEVAREQIRRIRDEVFGPPAENPPLLRGDFASICLDNVLVAPEVRDRAEGTMA